MKPGIRSLAALTLVLSVAGLPAAAEAQSNDWEFVIAPFGLAASLTGDIGAGPIEGASVDLSFGDILENLKAVAMVHGEVWKGNWGVMGDLLWMRLGDDTTLRGPASRVLDMEVDLFSIEGFLGHRFLGPNRQVDVFGGVRVWDVGIDLDLVDTERARTLGDGWVDPVIGARILQDVAEDWFVTGRGDIGGFGIGSTFSWNFQGGVGWEPASWFSLLLQYKGLGADFENDETGEDYFSYDAIAHGPILGFVFRF